MQLSDRFGVSALVAGMMTLIAGGVQAEPTALFARNDPSQPNYFTVNFPPELGGPQTADIRSTRFILRYDPEAGTASVVSWFQRISPLSLAGFSTGNITVRLGGDSSGVFDADEPGQPENGEFSTTEAYNVFFTGDLSPFGLQSPFFIPSSSTGTVTFDPQSASSGSISMEWTGLGTIPNPFDPANPFVFTYACAVNSRFVTTTSCENVDTVDGFCYGHGMRVVVHMADASANGESTAIVVNGEPYVAQVNGNRASFILRKRYGEQQVTIEAGQPNCQPPMTVECDE